MIEDTYTEDLAEEMRQRLTLAGTTIADAGTLITWEYEGGGWYSAVLTDPLAGLDGQWSTTVPGFHDLSTPELFNILADPAVAGVYVHSTRSPDVKRIR